VADVSTSHHSKEYRFHRAVRATPTLESGDMNRSPRRIHEELLRYQKKSYKSIPMCSTLFIPTNQITPSTGYINLQNKTKRLFPKKTEKKKPAYYTNVQQCE
jgi:hypothetical protein